MLAETRTIRVGDYAPLFDLLDQDERRIFLSDKAGKPTLLFFYANDKIMECQNVAFGFRDFFPFFNELDVQIFGISKNIPQERKTFAQEHHIPFPLLSDSDKQVRLQYGVSFTKWEDDKTHFLTERIAILLDRNLRVVKIYALSIDLEPQFKDIQTDIQLLLREEKPRYVMPHAPVLLISQVFDENFCQHLIKTWHTQGHEDASLTVREGNFYHTVRRRQDHIVQPGELYDQLDQMMRHRVFPEIKKSFNFNCTQKEAYIIACYDALTGGYYRPHRDKKTTIKTAHRVWGISINLNATDTYQGGCLRFPEYGPLLYKLPIGTSVIYSAALMREVTDVLSGQRFALLSYFYDDAENQ